VRPRAGSHHVSVTLPDGRGATADYRQSIVHVIRRVLACVGTKDSPDPADWDLIGDWLTRHPEQACTAEQVRTGTCTHPPASPEPYTPPRYKPDDTPATARPAEPRRAA